MTVQYRKFQGITPRIPRMAVAVETMARYIRRPPITPHEREEAAEALALLRGLAEAERSRLAVLMDSNSRRQASATITDAERQAVREAWAAFQSENGPTARRKTADPAIASRLGIPLRRVREILRTGRRPVLNRSSDLPDAGV